MQACLQWRPTYLIASMSQCVELDFLSQQPLHDAVQFLGFSTGDATPAKDMIHTDQLSDAHDAVKTSSFTTINTRDASPTVLRSSFLARDPIVGTRIIWLPFHMPLSSL